MNGQKKFVEVDFVPLGEDKRTIRVEGNGIGYKINAPDSPGCLKVWKDELTHLVPLTQVREVRVVL